MKVISINLSVFALFAGAYSAMELFLFVQMGEFSAPQQAGQISQILAQAAIPYFMARLWNDITGISLADEIKRLLSPAKIKADSVVRGQCPECGSKNKSTEGKHTSPDGSRKIISYSCDACGHEWTESKLR